VRRGRGRGGFWARLRSGWAPSVLTGEVKWENCQGGGVRDPQDVVLGLYGFLLADLLEGGGDGGGGAYA